MRDTDIFKLLNDIDDKYLAEAENYKPEKKKKSAAVILRVVFPAAALFAVMAVLFVFLFPSKVPDNTSPVDPHSPLSPLDPFTPIEYIRDEIIYKNFEDHAEITDYVGPGSTVVVPDTINGLPVTVVKLDHLNTVLSEVNIQGQNLESIDVPENTSITLTIGAEVTNLEFSLLHSKNVSSISVDPGNKEFTSFSGMLYTKDCKTLLACPAGIPASEILYHPANEGVSNDSTAFLAAQLRTVRSGAFKNCTGIRSISFPDKLLNIEESSLSGCTALRSVVLPAGLMTVPYDCFRDCSNLLCVVYNGSKKDFEKLNLSLSSDILIYYSENDCTDAELFERIVSAFEKAEKAYSLFTRFGTIPHDENQETDGYYKVTLPGISSLADLHTLLSESFEDEVVSRLLDDNENDIFREIDNELYCRPEEAPISFDKKEKEYFVLSKEEQGYILVVRSTVPNLPYSIFIENQYVLRVSEEGRILFGDPFVLPAKIWYDLYLSESAE